MKIKKILWYCFSKSPKNLQSNSDVQILTPSFSRMALTNDYPEVIKRKVKSSFMRYGFAFFITLLGLFLKIYLIKIINWPEGSFVLSTASIISSAWYGGFGPGIMSTFINYLISDYFFIGAKHSFIIYNSLPDNIRITIFVIEGIIMSWFLELLHRARKKAEETMLIASQRQQFFQSLIENVNDYAVFMINSRGTIVSWNRGATAITGFPAEEIVNKNISRLFLRSGIKKDKLFKFLRVAKKKGRFEDESWKVRKNGSKFWSNMIITPLFNTNKSFLGYSIIIRDLSQRKKIEDLKSEFLSTAAHELNTPLTIAKMISESLIKRFKKNSNIQIGSVELQDLDDELTRLVILVSDLLDVSRIEREKMVLSLKRNELSKLVTKVVSKMRKINDKGQIVYQNYTKVWAIFDSDRIEQVLINLISNAVKYSDNKSQVEVSTSIFDHQVTISIKDSGKGIPRNQLSHIFEQYYQGEASPNRGFGLGLYISKKIIELHNGKIWVDSKEGEGSVFSFSLPTN